MLKSDCTDNDPDSFSRQVEGVIPALQYNKNISPGDRRKMKEGQDKALKQLLGDTFSENSEPCTNFEGVDALLFQKILAQNNEILEKIGKMFAPKIKEDEELCRLRTEKEKMSLELQIAKVKIDLQKANQQLKNNEGVCASSDKVVGQKRRFEAGKDSEEGNVSDKQQRVRRGTVVGKQAPERAELLYTMNALFNEKARPKLFGSEG